MTGVQTCALPIFIGRFLIRNAADIIWLDLDHRIHGFPNRSLIVMARSSKTSGVGPSTRKCRPVISSTGTIANFPTTTYCGWVRRVRPERNDRQGFFAANTGLKIPLISTYYEILTRHSLLRFGGFFLGRRIAQSQHVVVHMLCTICSIDCALDFPEYRTR